MGDSENILFNTLNIKLNTDQNGNICYTIPKGTKIYRGGYPADMHPNAFFGFNSDHVTQYGSVTEYTIKENLNVLAIMKMDNSSNFYNENTEIQNALDQSYSYSNSKKIRDSIPAYDYAVVNHICKNPTYDGYAMHDGYETDAGGTFHAELVICNCYDRVEQGAKGEQAVPKVQRKKRPLPNTPKYESPLSEVASSTGLFQSPVESPEKKALGKSKTKRLLFGSPNHSPSKLMLDFDNDGNKSDNINANLFTSPPNSPRLMPGGKRKTKRRNRKTKSKIKRRNRKTKNKSKRRRNRRSRKIKH